MNDEKVHTSRLERLVRAIERLSPRPAPEPNFNVADAFVWAPATESFTPVKAINRLPLALLKGIEGQAQALLENTQRFAQGLPANNALLWGARGMGKSSLVKAIHGAVTNSEDATAQPIKLIEVHREDIESLPHCLSLLRDQPSRYILFTDDLSFDRDDSSYKSLKTVLEGGIEGRLDNVIFYATSNRRHMMPRDMDENENASALHPSETVEEKVSLSDRFGLWLGFHSCTQDDYLAMVQAYVDHFGLRGAPREIKGKAIAWSMTRGARSGRVAWQFIQDLAGAQGVKLNLS